MADSAKDRFGDNPFYVLGVRPGASRAEMERAGQRLLAMLDLGLSAAESYDTPVGERERSADKVRQAMAELRDPEKRLAHELWARLEPRTVFPASTVKEADDSEAERCAPWLDAPAALGWRRP